MAGALRKPHNSGHPDGSKTRGFFRDGKNHRGQLRGCPRDLVVGKFLRSSGAGMNFYSEQLAAGCAKAALVGGGGVRRALFSTLFRMGQCGVLVVSLAVSALLMSGRPVSVVLLQLTSGLFHTVVRGAEQRGRGCKSLQRNGTDEQVSQQFGNDPHPQILGSLAWPNAISSQLDPSSCWNATSCESLVLRLSTR